MHCIYDTACAPQLLNWKHTVLICFSHSTGIPAWKRLVNCTLSLDEQISLIADIFSDHDETKVVTSLRGDDAQSFVDVMDEVCLPIFSLRRNNLTDQIHTCTFCQIDPRYVGATVAEEMSGHLAQNMRPPGSAPKVSTNTGLL